MVQALEREPLDNVIVLVSLSKTLGIPGVRLGYLYAADTALVPQVPP
jgi:histidinol-phosphate/aromatic aminotransferase/cobyric acid decarboxylase-like protein